MEENTEFTYNRENENFEPPKGQMKFEIDDSRTKLVQLFNSFQHTASQKATFLEVSPIWNTLAYAFSVVSFASNILLIILGGIFRFSKLPDKIPLFYQSVDQTWVQVDKSLIFILPVFFLVLFVLQMKFISMIFIKDRRLAITILWVTTLINILFLIAITQIYKLVS